VIVYLTATPAGSSSCARCFRADPHEHVAELDLKLALDRAEVLASPEYAEMVGPAIAAERRDQVRLARALLAVHADLRELERWVKTQ
jgi:hypothetical protein